MPAIEAKQNIVMLRKIMEQQEYIIATINKINDNQKKMENTVMTYSSTLGLLRQKIIHIETVQENQIKNSWF
tara:strand:+ start:71 stop:286 length:216 start_codon:yes stop_codon:yes gene_type:complete